MIDRGLSTSDSVPGRSAGDTHARLPTSESGLIVVARRGGGGGGRRAGGPAAFARRRVLAISLRAAQQLRVVAVAR
jgi:hypothetical protein